MIHKKNNTKPRLLYCRPKFRNSCKWRYKHGHLVARLGFHNQKSMEKARRAITPLMTVDSTDRCLGGEGEEERGVSTVVVVGGDM